MQSGQVLTPNSSRRTAERRWAILQAVRRDQRISVAQLSHSFGVSEVSIRRDLEHLEGMGLLRRVHGAAEALARPQQGSVFEARLLDRVEVKRALGQAAGALIQPGDIILLDSGTTMLEIARAIPRPLLEGGGLTVICRSLLIAAELRAQRQIRLILLGGVYQPDYDALVGSQLEHALQGMHVNTLYVGTDGVTAERGLTTDNVLEAPLYHLMARCADRVVVVTDSSKIGVNKLQATLPFSDVHSFITDSDAPDDFVQALRQRGMEVILVPARKR